MRIVWDEPKRRSNLDKHGFDFAQLDVAVLQHASYIVATRAGRYKALVDFRGASISVVFRPLGTEAVSIISMRPANLRERRLSK